MLFNLCQWLYDSHIGTAIRESIWLFPIIETIHVLSLALLVGTIALVDLRLLGLTMKREPVIEVTRQILPLTWCGFAACVVSGSLLFWAEAAKMYSNPAFRVKLIMLILVGLNPLIFHTTIYRRVAVWNEAIIAPSRARLAAVLSLTVWSGIIVAGRAIAYFH
jgi:hypothetical protein